MSRALNHFVREENARLGAPSWRVLESPQGGRVRIDGGCKISLCSNNYLGLANHPVLKEAAIKAIEKYGVGTAAARSLSGSTPIHEELEEELADLKGAEAALVFNSGNAANGGVIPAVAVDGDAVFSDELNHGSIVDGCRLSRAEKKIYRHNDLAHLEERLAAGRGFRKRMIVTDTVFSMDGHIAQLPEIVALCEKYDAFLMVDEAHATGVLGAHGGGGVEHFGLDGKVDVLMGTLGKALGSVGGYIAGSNDLIAYLARVARTFLFTTSLPASCAAASLAAVRLLRKDSGIRQKLWDNVTFFKSGLTRLGFDTMGSQTPIVPILVGDDEIARRFAERLFRAGVYVSKIGPPYVPPKTSRLRTIITAAHREEDLKKTIDAFERVSRQLGLISSTPAARRTISHFKTRRNLRRAKSCIIQ
ncbi:MAG: aminotransferase class I/II-fold pyridoxal phosphate-dependent enzyme [Verrucomicrobia bacterium]|nr:aminotransferase class I/II-fold pyridoxal phosphate-dependent enzyme [Verrucomicrobiota bacterium]